MSCFSFKRTEVVEPKVIPPLKVRFLCCNDVYLLDNFSNFASAKQMESKDANITIATLAGDFLAPSLLSTIDSGAGMVQVMNAAGIDYVCIGNHENDIKLSEMHKRMKESNFTWINSNMLNLPLASDMDPLPRYKIIEITANQQKRRIGIIGLNTEDPKCVPVGRFGNCNIDPVNDTAKRLYKELIEKEKVDVVIPLTHQYMPEDRKLAEMDVGFPVIIGGHDHSLFNEEVLGCKIIKLGMNLENIGIVDLEWPTASTIKPTVNITVKDATSYPKDPKVEAVIKKHKYVLEQMEKAALFGLPKGHTLTSKNVREQPASMATFLFTLVKRIMQVDCVLLCGGGVRADTDYTGRELFTYADLVAEFTFPTPIIVLPIPGHVIVDIIQYTRAGALKSPPESKAYFIQTDDGIKWHSGTNTVMTIDNDIVYPEKLYKVAVNFNNAIRGLDKIEPLIEYVQIQVKNGNSTFLKEYDTTIEIKHLLIAHFSKLVLFNMISPSKVLEMDENKDGKISREEFRNAAWKVHGGDVSDILVENLFNIADLDGDGFIDEQEIQELLKLASDSYSGSTPVAEAISNISGWLTCLIGEVEKSYDVDVGSLYKTMSFDSPIQVFPMEKQTSDSKKVKIPGSATN